VGVSRPRAQQADGDEAGGEASADAHGAHTPLLVSHVRPDGQLPDTRQSGTHCPAHIWPDGQHTSLAPHDDDEAHDAPASGIPPPIPAMPPSPDGPPPDDDTLPITHRWMNGYVSVM